MAGLLWLAHHVVYPNSSVKTDSHQIRSNMNSFTPDVHMSYTIQSLLLCAAD